MKNQLVLTVGNNHVESCGTPPGLDFTAVDPKQRPYCAYFENDHGEQWVLTFDFNAKRGMLRGGDIGWEHPKEVRFTDYQLVVDLILDEEEHMWLAACGRAIRDRVAS